MSYQLSGPHGAVTQCNSSHIVRGEKAGCQSSQSVPSDFYTRCCFSPSSNSRGTMSLMHHQDAQAQNLQLYRHASLTWFRSTQSSTGSPNFRSQSCSLSIKEEYGVKASIHVKCHPYLMYWINSSAKL